MRQTHVQEVPYAFPSTFDHPPHHTGIIHHTVLAMAGAIISRYDAWSEGRHKHCGQKVEGKTIGLILYYTTTM
jgi:hypothetical protein